MTKAHNSQLGRLRHALPASARQRYCSDRCARTGAKAGLPAFTSTPTAGGGQNYTLSLQTCCC